MCKAGSNSTRKGVFAVAKAMVIDMYKISVPIMSSTVNERNRETYVRLCRDVGATRVFLAIASSLEPIPESLSENVAYFQVQGFEVGVWTDTIGHGKVLDHVEISDDIPSFPPMVDIMGDVRHYANCPLDAEFRSYITKFVASLAGTGADIVMLDDDFRMSQHGDALCCACPAHLERIGEILGEKVTREQIRPYVLSGKKNSYRDAWLQVQNAGLVELAQEIRTEVDRESPDVTVCLCTAHSPWNVDGTDITGITKILAGKNTPLLRLTGAPYWAAKTRKYPLITVFEIARMLASFVCEEGFELMSEGDVYPRPRYTCPASYLELYDAVTRVDGAYDGILKYMFDYVAGPNFETGYLRFHGESQPFFEKIPALFPHGANAGVRIITRPHTIRNADLDLSMPTLHSPRPLDGTMLGSCGIPTVYRGTGVCNSVFGENARLFDLSLLNEGTVLDAVSAVILTERGIDVGLDSHSGLSDKRISFLCTEDEEYKSFISDGDVRMLSARLKDGVKPLLFSVDGKSKQTVAYRYENEAGERFLVFLFEGDSVYDPASRICLSGLVKNYAVQRVLTEILPWVAREALPAYCEGNPELYLLCAKDVDSCSVALFNCFADSLTNPVIRLGERYREISCVGCDAELDGDKVALTSKLYGFTSAAFCVHR